MKRWTFGSIELLVASGAIAQTTTYRYDALGRLVTSQRSDGVTTQYTLDAAGNRTHVTTSGVANTPTVIDAGCEMPNIGSGYSHNPVGSGVTFAGQTGIAGNGSGWGFAAAPDGRQVCFVHGASTSYIEFTVNGLTVGQS